MRASLQRLPGLVAIVLFGGLVLGQLIRLHLFSATGGAVVALDIALAISVVKLLFQLTSERSLKAWWTALLHHPVWRWSFFFLVWTAASLLINLPHYTAKQDVVAASYYLRLLAVFLLLWLSAHFAPRLRRPYLRGWLLASVALLVLGYLQLIFVADFGFMARIGGWDPHIGRMLSTFFDPNYFGVYLVLVMVLALAQSWRQPAGWRWAWWTLFAASWLGLYLTYSRSAWIAGIIAVVGISLKRSWRLALILLLIFTVVLAFPNRLGQRFSDTKGINTGGTANVAVDNVCGVAKECDASGSARVVSLKRGLDLVSSDANLLTGVGYNAYGFALVKHKLLSSQRLSVHSSQGSDSSLLNILVTSGLPGLLLFGAFLIAVLRRLLFNTVLPDGWLSYGLGWFTVAWILASFLNNSLLYLSILVPWAAMVAVCLPDEKRSVSR